MAHITSNFIDASVAVVRGLQSMLCACGMSAPAVLRELQVHPSHHATPHAAEGHFTIFVQISSVPLLASTLAVLHQ